MRWSCILRGCSGAGGNIWVIAGMGLAIFSAMGSGLSAADDLDAEVEILKSGDTLQRLAILSEVEVCAPIPPRFQAPISGIASDPGQNGVVRVFAAEALCDVDDTYPTILPLLANASADPKVPFAARVSALKVLQHIADRAVEVGQTALITQLQAARATLSARGQDGEADATVQKMDYAIRFLKNSTLIKFTAMMLQFVQENARVVVAALVYLAGLVAVLSTYLSSPSRIAPIDELFRRLDVKLPGWLGGFNLSLRYFFLTPLLVGRGRVLDAWIAARVEVTNQSLTRTGVLREAGGFAIKSEGVAVGDPPEEALRRLMTGGTMRLVAFGSRKARARFFARVARLCLDKELILATAALPLWLDREVLVSSEDGAALVEKARSLFMLLIGAEVSADLFKLLVARGRIVVLLPDLASAHGREGVELLAVSFPVGACLIMGFEAMPQGLLVGVSSVEVISM
jgi:hypothetical protein